MFNYFIVVYFKVHIWVSTTGLKNEQVLFFTEKIICSHYKKSALMKRKNQLYSHHSVIFNARFECISLQFLFLMNHLFFNIVLIILNI